MTRFMYEGNVEDVWARVTETTGKDLSTSEFFIQIRPNRTRPTPDDPDWVQPDDIETVADSIKRVGQLVTGTKINSAVTKWWVWVKVVDNPETLVLKAGFFTVY